MPVSSASPFQVSKNSARAFGDRGAGRPDRRQFMTAGLGLAAIAAGGPARAQSVRRIGFLTRQAPGTLDVNLRSLEAGLVSSGYSPGQNLIIEAKYADGDARRFPALVTELLAAKVELIIAQADAAVYLKGAPVPVPVIFVFSGDPVAAKLTDSLAKPPPGVTGLTFMAAETSAKRLELLAEIIPNLKRFALIANPEHPGQLVEQAHAEAAARRLGVAVRAYSTPTPSDVGGALEAIASDRPDGVILFSDSVAVASRAVLADFGIKQRIPMIGGWEIFAQAGFLLSYGPNRLESYRRMAAYVDRILKGARAEDLPIEQPTRFELTINLKTARAIGIEVPPAVLLRANTVIE